MVLQNVTANLPVGTKGFVSRPRGDFQPGEYKRLSNVEIIGEKLVGRRNVKMPNYDDTGELTRKSGLRHVGFWQNWSVYSDDLSLIAYSTNGEVKRIADLTDLLPYTGYGIVGTGNLTYDGFHRIVGFFTYLGYNYILAFSYINRTDDNLLGGGYPLASGFKMYKFKDTPSTTEPPTITVEGLFMVGADESYNNGIPLPDTFVPGLEFQIGVATEFDFMNSYINNFFFFKERLFICTKNGLYFSRATEPGDFSLANGGGYFKTGEILTYAIASNDQIVVLSKDSVNVITYSDDPNVDAVVSEISDVIGGLTGCVFRSNIYFINNEGLFTINNQTVEKVIDTDFDDGLNIFENQTLSPFGEYLVLNKTYLSSLSGIPRTSSDYGVRQNLIVGSSEKESGFAIGNNIGTLPTETDIWEKLEGTKDYLAFEEAYDLPFAMDTAVQVARLGNLDDDAHDTVAMFTPPNAYPNAKYTIVPGRIYTLSAYFNPQIGWVDDGLNEFFTLYFEDNNNVAKFDTTVTPYDGFQVLEWVKPSMTIGTWSRASITFKVIDPTAVRMYLEVKVRETESINTLVGGIQFEEASEASDFISQTNTDWATAYVPQTQFVSSPNSFTTIIANPSFVYWQDVYPHWFPEGQDPNGNNTDFNTYFLNMDTGAVHVLDYKAVFDENYTNFISGVVVNSTYSDDVPSGDTLFFLNSDRYGMTDDLPNQYVSYMTYELDTTVYDHVVMVDYGDVKTRKKTDPRYLVEVDSYCPDGNKYMMKKFKNFEIMGKMPERDFEISVALDNRDYGIPRSLTDNESGLPNSRPHFPHRIGLNQRAHWLSFKFATKYQQPADINFDFFELSDMKFLWTFTSRDTETSDYEATPVSG